MRMILLCVFSICSSVFAEEGGGYIRAGDTSSESDITLNKDDPFYRMRQQWEYAQGPERPWKEMSREERMEHLKKLARSSGKAITFTTETSLIWLEPITGKAYITELAKHAGTIPERYIAQGPKELERTRKIVEGLGGDTEAFDAGATKIGESILKVLDTLSDPKFILAPYDK